MAPTPKKAASDILDRKEVGARLRAERKARKLSLKSLSGLSGVALSTLSKAELGQVTLSYDKFAALARALGLDMTQLFTRHSSAVVAKAPTVVKSSIAEASSFFTDNYHYRFLLGDYPNKAMTPMVGTSSSHTTDEFKDYIRHAGQEFVFVLKGRVRLQFETGESVVLSRFECAYFDSGVGHVYLRASKHPGQVLVVCTDVGDVPLTRKKPPVAARSFAV